MKKAETAILVRMDPEGLRRILSGDKTIEIRKSTPRAKVPFTMYLYCPAKDTKDPWKTPESQHENGSISECSGYVAGECLCTGTETYWNANQVPKEILDRACMSRSELLQYAGAKKCTAWHLEHVTIYEQPKKLSEFGLRQAPQGYQSIGKELADYE